MSPGLHVTKMSGAGNDFVVLGPAEARAVAGREADWARRLCRRGLSIGADGLLLVEPAGADRVRVRFHNPDGSVAFCGNGSRCAARFAHLRGLAGATMMLDTAAGEVAAQVAGGRVQLTLPAPVDLGERVLVLGAERIAGRWIEACVPHFVVAVDDLGGAPLARWGPAIVAHAAFAPAGTNFDLVTRTADGAVALRTWERGVGGETLACGSGAVAAAFAAAADSGFAERRLRVHPASGIPLEVELVLEASTPVQAKLSGDARFVFEGRLLEDDAV